MINHLNVIKNFKCLRKTLLRERKDKLQSGGKCLGITYPTQDFPLEGMKNTQYQRYSLFKPPNKKRTKAQALTHVYISGGKTYLKAIFLLLSYKSHWID